MLRAFDPNATLSPQQRGDLAKEALSAGGRSAGARRKEREHVTADGFGVHSFGTLLAELATLTRNRVIPAGADERAAFDLPAEASPLQVRAFELIGVSPDRM